MEDFISKQTEVKLDENGNDHNNKDEKEGDVEDKVIKLAEAKMKEDDSLDMGMAQSLVLSENPKLADEYNKKFEGEK